VFRPPGGDISKEAVELVNNLGYRYVLWSWRVDTRDWASVSVDSVVNTVLSGVKNGDIILFHDYVAGKSPTAEALEILIPKLQAQGYQFVTVSDLASL
jgi:peptidoglycan/xylan/chitin deacetylase (PgdA/CDA1 family)